MNYSCILSIVSEWSNSSEELLEAIFSNFRYLHTLVTDQMKMFNEEEFQTWGKDRRTIYLSGALYHSATNGAAERHLSSRREKLMSIKQALSAFLMQYCRTPLPSGYSPSELLLGRLKRTKIGVLLPSPAHAAKKRQVHKTRHQSGTETAIEDSFQAYLPCYTLHCKAAANNKTPR